VELINTYTIFWLTGEIQLVKGSSPRKAMNNAGIGGLLKLRAMDFYSEGDKRKDFY
jgi:hypothetical protein